MKLGFVSDSLGAMSLVERLGHASCLGVPEIEVNTCGWSKAPHFDLAQMKSSAVARQDFTRFRSTCGG